MNSQWDTIVIGAGHNGLTTAALLAKRGRSVLVLERSDRIGGLAVGEEFHPGYHSTGVLSDTGSVRPWVIAELGLAGHGLKVRSESVPVLLSRLQGRGILLSRDPGAMAGEIGSSDLESYSRYRGFLDRIAPVLRRVFDEPPHGLEPSGVGDFWRLGSAALALRRLGTADMTELMRIAPMCVADWLAEWFEEEALRAALAAPAIHSTYAAPWSPGSNFNLLLAETLHWREIDGGARALVQSLERAARSNGVEIRTDAPVDGLVLEDGRVVGVRLAGGESLRSKTVAASCDPKHLFLDLLPPATLSEKFEHEIVHLRTRGTTARIELALSRAPRWSCRPELSAERVRIGEKIDDLERAFDPVKYRRFPERPMLEIGVPSLRDSGLAPSGHHVAEISVHFVPCELEGGWSAQEEERLYRNVVGLLSEHSPGIEETVVGARVLTPADLEERFGPTGGQLFHVEHALDQWIVRPTPECARYATPFPGLFLCGSGSHPGGGLTAAPGGLAARAILSGS